jgi:hypothetical protein
MHAIDALIRISRALPHILHMLYWIMRYQSNALNIHFDESEPDWDSILVGTERNRKQIKVSENQSD